MTWCCLFLAYFLRFEAARFKSRIIFDPWIGPNRPFAANHSRGTKPPCWRVKVALGQDKQRKLITISHCLCVLFVLSQCDFCSPARRFCTTWMASCKGPILTLDGQKEVVLACNKKKKARNLTNWPCFITCITNIFSVHRIHVYSTRKSDQTGLSYTLGRRLKFEHSI